jgi:hypothetical protein
MARLSAAARRKLPPSAFVFPDTRSYPIHDLKHARIALTDAAGTGAEAAVKAKVRTLFPQIQVS